MVAAVISRCWVLGVLPGVPGAASCSPRLTSGLAAFWLRLTASIAGSARLAASGSVPARVLCLDCFFRSKNHTP